ncbi:protein of unknown function DUF309 [Geobacter metallireducens RCH3]|uniref:DUF309 domain-containing protein n=1 Tax=Geobacter metallireducens (strain ATCC 53774 / DSM 7210 / GS-15) TaxID=269799 RepID=Q39Q87_GEOMG|nr:DUF309 domain-containing protein [Geobacter metallireducens]ABB33587.1 protein of unknown function DUF309 [Geobacter metallireducens GS-15]EHP87697.1 protein of unknown function DUF309 [Geobacter metallireducens RCH3]
MEKMPETSRACEGSPSGQLLLGIRQFNREEWFECHETLEALWLKERGDVRNFYQGIIQIAIALHHWRNGNLGGSLSLLAGGRGYLLRVPEVCLWVDVAGFIAQADRVISALERLGKEKMGELDPVLIPRLKTVEVTE